MGSYVMVEDERDRVMPTAAAVRSAGRYSLHLAICMHGGYAAVAEALDRRRCWPRYPNLREDLGTLRAELVDFARREGLERGSMPTLTMLRDAGRTDLFSTVACMGAPLCPSRDCTLGGTLEGESPLRGTCAVPVAVVCVWWRACNAVRRDSDCAVRDRVLG